MMGLVSLVGAGPGDPELLTLRAARRLADADLVLYDALVSQEVLRLASRARRFFVGKRAGRPGIGQHAIHGLLIRGARRGFRVVRLKNGDPFVFGRGGEEMLALAAAGVPVEIVPGATSALAAPALAGIPLTHRGLASSFVVVSGHAPEAFTPVLDGLAPGAATVVVLMGLATRATLAAHLLAREWPAATPAAVVSAAGTPRMHVWRGALGSLADASFDPAPPGAPAVIVIGEVVQVATAAAGLAQAEPIAAAQEAWEGAQRHVGA